MWINETIQSEWDVGSADGNMAWSVGLVYGSSVSPLQRLKCSKFAMTLARCAERMRSFELALKVAIDAANARMSSRE